MSMGAAGQRVSAHAGDDSVSRWSDRNALVRSCCGLAEQLVGRGVLDDPAGVHHHDAVGDLAGEPHLVGDRRSWSCGRARVPASPPAPRRPSRRPARWSARRTASPSVASPAPARSRRAAAARRTAGWASTRPCRPGRPARADASASRRASAFARAQHPHRAVPHVLGRRHVWEQVEMLEDETDFASAAGELAGARPSFRWWCRGGRSARRRSGSLRCRPVRGGSATAAAWSCPHPDGPMSTTTCAAHHVERDVVEDLATAERAGSPRARKRRVRWMSPR